MRRCLIVMVAFSIFAAPLYADTIPSRRPAPANDATVTDRVVSLGVNAERAQSVAGSLTDSEVVFFSAHPECVQIVGAQEDFFSGESNNLWYETLVGAAVLGGGLGLVWYMLNNNEKD